MCGPRKSEFRASGSPFGPRLALEASDLDGAGGRRPGLRPPATLLAWISFWILAISADVADAGKAEGRLSLSWNSCKGVPPIRNGGHPPEKAAATRLFLFSSYIEVVGGFRLSCDRPRRSGPTWKFVGFLS